MYFTAGTTKNTRSAMFSDMAFSACPATAKHAKMHNCVKDTALAVSFFAFIFLVSIFAGIIGMLSVVSVVLVLLVLFVNVRIIVPRQGKAHMKLICWHVN